MLYKNSIDVNCSFFHNMRTSATVPLRSYAVLFVGILLVNIINSIMVLSVVFFNVTVKMSTILILQFLLFIVVIYYYC